MNLRRFAILTLSFSPSLALGQNAPQEVKAILERPVQPREVVTFQLQQYLMAQVPKLSPPATPEEWTAESEQIRKRLLERIFGGWPKEWVDAPTRFEDLASLPSGPGYRLRKLRYQIVPGFYAPALLYLPEKISGKLPAVLNVDGHYPQGKAMEYAQILCINQALKGMIALHLEWIEMGELRSSPVVRGSQHWKAAHLTLVGVNPIGLFYLAMRRGLDYLYDRPDVDKSRIGMTGISGGGWQSIVLSSLDPRIAVSIPVAGHDSLEGRIQRPVDAGDIEQNSPDFIVGQDYSTLTAMRAPRPTLLINSAEDSCCWRAPLVKPHIYDPVRPFFRLYGKEHDFQFYEDTEISAHNYGLGNREKAYEFLLHYFHLPGSSRETPVGQEVKTYDELVVGLPANNLTLLTLARELAHSQTGFPDSVTLSLPRTPQKAKLQELVELVRYEPVAIQEVWPVANTHHNAVESVSYRFWMSNGLSATGVWLREQPTADGAPLTVVLNDEGKNKSGTEVWGELPQLGHDLDRQEQVLAIDWLFTGDASPDQYPYHFVGMLAATGHRALGMEAAQVLALAHWAKEYWGAGKVRLQCTGIRSQSVGLVSAALEPTLFSDITVEKGIESLHYLLDKPVYYLDAPDLFYVDLLKELDLPQLAKLAAPTKIVQEHFLKAHE